MSDRGFHITVGGSTDVVAHRITLFDGNTEVGSADYQDADVAYKPMEDDDPPAPQPTMRTFDLLLDPYWLSLNLDGTYRVEHRSIDDAGLVSPPLEGDLSVDFVAPEVATGFDPF